LSDYTVGIDLGTTNSVVSYYSNNEDQPDIKLLGIKQNIENGVVENRESLPSFLYYPLENEREAGLTEKFEWQKDNWIAGVYARDRGVEVPSHFVSSAKSWLCQNNINRKDAILPFQSEESPDKISPFDASILYLQTIAASWREQLGCELGDQNIILTVPASFDEEAKKLTEEAAQIAGIHNLTLLEEPQAALYAWIATHGDAWRNEVEKDDVILVCDIGGGTSDFSLIRVVSEDGNLSLSRTAVGDHILLGGDNMDLALAYHAKAKMESGKKLNSSQLRSLWYKARKVKEDILNGKTEKAQFTILGSGLKKLIGGTLKAEFSEEEVQNILVDGFFPKCSFDEHPLDQSGAGVQEIGLPYASDAAITKHLARFIARQVDTPDFSWPSKILFNGGVFNCDKMRTRLLDVINQWLQSVDQKPVDALNHSSLDHAVAKGASYYGWTRDGKGIRIRSGISRSYYIQVESAMPAIPGMPAPQKALCIAPFGMEEGSHIQLEGKTFALTTGIPASFQFLSSTTRHEDSSGTVLEDWDEEELEETSSMDITLDSAPDLENPIPVQLGTKVTETGTLEVFFKHTESERQWHLQYSVREE
jgi:molecular chaperone DnaK (HSP70)